MKFLLLFLTATLTLADMPSTISAPDPRIQIIGRVDRSDPAHVRIAYPGVTLRFRLTGDLAVLQLRSDLDDTYVAIIVEGSKPQIHRLAKGDNEIILSAADLGPGPHTVAVVNAPNYGRTPSPSPARVLEWALRWPIRHRCRSADYSLLETRSPAAPASTTGLRVLQKPTVPLTATMPTACCWGGASTRSLSWSVTADAASSAIISGTAMY